MTDDFFRNRLHLTIYLRHPVVVLDNRMPSQEIEASIAQLWSRQVKAGKKKDGFDLFGSVSEVIGGGASITDRHRLATPRPNV